MKFTKCINDKVVGSTFYPVDIAKFNLSNVDTDGIHIGTFDAWLYPETDNKYDVHAKSVLLFIPVNGTSNEVIKVGYVKKDSYLYRAIKVCTHKPVNVKVTVKAWSEIGLNNSFTITEG